MAGGGIKNVIAELVQVIGEGEVKMLVLDEKGEGGSDIGRVRRGGRGEEMAKTGGGGGGGIIIGETSGGIFGAEKVRGRGGIHV